MPLCSLVDLPFFANDDGERLLPGTTWFAGFRKWRPNPLSHWLLWRVEEGAGTLCLVSVVEPGCRVPLTAELAQAVVPITLSEHFSCGRFPALYALFHQAGYELWASEDAKFGVIALNARSFQADVWCDAKASAYCPPSVSQAVRILADLFEQVQLEAARQLHRQQRKAALAG